MMGKRRAGELSTNALALLLVIAILVSVGGTLVSLSRLHAQSLEAITGGATTGTMTASVSNVTAISLQTATVAFGTVSLGTAYDTTGGSPAPFNVQNDGSVNVNVTINASAIFSGLTTNDSSYRFKCRLNEGPNCPTGSPSTFTDLPTANDTLLNRTAVYDLPFANTNDSRFVDIQINVPSDEPGGSKSSTVTFTATQI